MLPTRSGAYASAMSAIEMRRPSTEVTNHLRHLETAIAFDHAVMASRS